MSGEIDDNQKGIIKEAVQHFVDAQLQDQKPDIDEFVKKYPDLELQLRQSIQDVRKIDALFDTLVQADESDFEYALIKDNLIGQKIGGFEIVKVIGRGGMGVVYLAHDTKLDRSVAVKSIPAKLADDSTARMRFQREAKLLASLNHPNIAVIHEIIEEEKSGYLILEYVPGQTLAERIAGEPLKLEGALSFALEVAEAVSAAHKKGVIHRDLKPGNIKITPDGRVKVLDFGLAKPSAGESTDIELTSTEPGHIIGTPDYMSPEQARGNPVDHRTDIWSFGCIMYQMLTGQSPFESDTATDTLARIIERQPDWEMLPNETPENIRVLLRHCLEKDPERRLGEIADAAIEISETLSKPQITPPVTIPAKFRRIPMIIGTVVIGIILSSIVLRYIPREKIQSFPKEIRLVVLPFENLGLVDDDYFAAGMTDEITSRLAGIHGLSVISRNSAMQYKNREKSTPQIVKELNVDYILEGTVQHERPSDPNSKVRIRLQLIKAAYDTHVWTQSYDDDMSEVFRLQSDVAEQVARAMDVTLLEPERRALAYRPTENMQAYSYYLYGIDYLRGTYLENDVMMAVRMYEKAIELDPTFALAYARLSRSHVMMYWYYYDRSEQRLALAKQAVDKAFQLNPDLPEAHLALGLYYHQGHLDYDRALEQYAIARKSQPNNSSLIAAIGGVQRRQGKFEQALANLKKASELDPLYAWLMLRIGTTFEFLRNYPEAERYYNMAIELDPTVHEPYGFKAMLYRRWEGSTRNARAVLAEALKNIKTAENPFVSKLVMLDVLDRKYQDVLDRLSLQSEGFYDHNYFVPNAQRYAHIYRFMGNNQKAKKYYEQAKDILESKIAEDPNDPRCRSAIGMVYAGLGRKEEAIREGELAVKLLPVTKDAWGGIIPVEVLTRIYVMVGEYDKAIDQLEFLLDRPGHSSIPLLQHHPIWDPLRNHPRFKKLIQKDIKN